MTDAKPRKPCHCGGHVFINDDGLSTAPYAVECLDCCRDSGFHKTIEEAIAAWDAPDARERALLEDMRLQVSMAGEAERLRFREVLEYAEDCSRERQKEDGTEGHRGFGATQIVLRLLKTLDNLL